MFTLLCHQAQLQTSQPSNPSQFWKMGHGAASWGIYQNFKKKLTFVDLHWPGFSQKFHLKGPNASEICSIRFLLSNLPKRYHGNEIRSFVLTILSNHSGWIELRKKTSLNLETGHLMPQNAMLRHAASWSLAQKKKSANGYGSTQRFPCPRGTWATWTFILDSFGLFNTV